jgi:hypothetical protein
VSESPRKQPEKTPPPGAAWARLPVKRLSNSTSHLDTQDRAFAASSSAASAFSHASSTATAAASGKTEYGKRGGITRSRSSEPKPRADTIVPATIGRRQAVPLNSVHPGGIGSRSRNLPSTQPTTPSGASRPSQTPGIPSRARRRRARTTFRTTSGAAETRIVRCSIPNTPPLSVQPCAPYRPCIIKRMTGERLVRGANADIWDMSRFRPGGAAGPSLLAHCALAAERRCSIRPALTIASVSGCLVRSRA